MKKIAFSLFAFALLSSCGSKHSFVGTITDSVCSTADHSRMQMGPTDAECAAACNDVHGASWNLYDGKESYELSDQKTPEQFAGQKVRVAGTLDAKAKKIQVESIIAMK